METKRTKHSVYNLNYHIVLVTKFRHSIFNEAREGFLKEKIVEVCGNYEWELMAIEVMPDHIHLFVSAPPKIAPLTIASTIKSITAVAVFKRFKGLKQRYFRGSGLWSDGCYYGSAGTVSSETIKRYIEEQKTS